VRIAARLNSREQTALIFCLAFMGATLLLSFVDQNSFIHSVGSTMDPNYLQFRYTGTIVIPDQPNGMCRFVQYDNKTSEFRNTDVAECYAKPGVNSPYSRMNSLRDTFKK
jgi:hypothetical protein